MRKLLADHRETLIVIGVLLILVAAFRAAPILDPRIGFDGWSDLLYALVAAAKMVVVAYGGWYCKKLYHGDTPDILQWSDDGDAEPAMWAVLVDRLEYGFWVLLWFAALFLA